MADFLDENVHRVRKLQEGKDHRRAFILDLLMPEVFFLCYIIVIQFLFNLICFCIPIKALVYGVQQTFHVTYQEAKEMVVYGLKNVSVNTSI